MKKKYIVFIFFLLLGIFGLFNNSTETKAIKQSKPVKKEVTKEEFKYSTKNYDNINDLVKDTIVEEVKVNYVCDKDVKNGFIEEDNKVYYYKDNEIVTGRLTVDNETYFFDEEGIMLKNIELDNEYYGSDGKLVLGEYEKDGNRYYRDKKGIVKDKFIDGKYYDKDGLCVENMIEENNDIFYYQNGDKIKGLIKINNIRYYFDFDNGKLVKKDVKSVIDISTWQDDIDFDSLNNSNLVDGIIVRVGFGSLVGEDCTLDNRFERNISEIKRLGIPYGIYFYGYAQNEEASKIEASFVSNVIKEYDLKLSFPIFYDAELTSFHGFKYTKSVYKKVIKTFINEIKDYSVGIYGNVKMFSSTLDFLDKKIPKWVADYNDKCSYDGDFIGWQYTSSGKIPGIRGNVDMNIFY